MNRDEALKLAKMAYKSIKQQIYEWSMDYSRVGRCIVSLNWNGGITVDNHTFTEKDLLEECEEKKKCRTCGRPFDKIERIEGVLHSYKTKIPSEPTDTKAEFPYRYRIEP